jgi:hypothetical protein
MEHATNTVDFDRPKPSQNAKLWPARIDAQAGPGRGVRDRFEPEARTIVHGVCRWSGQLPSEITAVCTLHDGGSSLEADAENIGYVEIH